MADEKQLNAIRIFCSKPYKDHGKKTDGYYGHDWADLVGTIQHFDKSKKLDEKERKAIARDIRREYPNSSDWNVRVNAAGAHQNILAIIREGIERELSTPKFNASDWD